MKKSKIKKIISDHLDWDESLFKVTKVRRYMAYCIATVVTDEWEMTFTILNNGKIESHG